MYKTQIETVLTLDAYARHCFAGCFAINELASLVPPPPPPPPKPSQQATPSRTTTTTKAAAAAMKKGQQQKRQQQQERRWQRRRQQRRPQQQRQQPYDDGFRARRTSCSGNGSSSSSSSQDRAYVINYDESNEPGSHWVVVYDSLSPSSSSPEFFDPAGLPPLDDRIKTYLLGPDYTYNPNVLQQVQGNACGFYCVYYILQRSRNVSADDIVEFLASLSSSSGAGSQSDFYVKDFIYSQFKPVFN